MTEYTRQDLEAHKANLQEFAEFGNAIERLSRNPDFKKVLVKGFMEQEALRCLAMSVEPANPAHIRADMLDMAKGAAQLRNYLMIQEKMANQAKIELAEIDAIIEEADAEQERIEAEQALEPRTSEGELITEEQQ
jgi:hypothetical protein